MCRGGLNGFPVVGTINVERGDGQCSSKQEGETRIQPQPPAPARARLRLRVARPRVCDARKQERGKEGNSRSANTETSAKRQARLDLRFNLVLHRARDTERDTHLPPPLVLPSASTDPLQRNSLSLSSTSTLHRVPSHPPSLTCRTSAALYLVVSYLVFKQKVSTRYPFGCSLFPLSVATRPFFETHQSVLAFRFLDDFAGVDVYRLYSA